MLGKLHVGLASVLGIGGALASSVDCVIAQIVPDATLGAESSVVTPNTGSLPIDLIQGGATRGANLFHSFEQFSVLTGREAFFNNALDIQNIISRVTGASSSNIDGLIRANGTANLFLLNPHGITFGPNASLAIGGSFVASTANSINFTDGKQFSATAPQTTPLLTVSVPIGLQYGGTATEILLQGSTLAVQPDKTLALVGGNIALAEGELMAEGGRIELGSVASNSLVSLTPSEKGWSLGYEGAPNFQDIQLSQGAAVDASGEGGGDIQVQGRRVTLTDGSQIETTTGAEPGGRLSVTASESVELSGESAEGDASRLEANTEGAGAGGNLIINTGQLSIRDGGLVRTFTEGDGPGGTLTVTASELVEVSGESAAKDDVSRLLTRTQGDGSGGDLLINTGRLILRNGGRVRTFTEGDGPGGTLTVNASKSVELSGESERRSRRNRLGAETEGAGAGGNLIINTGRLSVRNGGQVRATTEDEGPGGTLTVNASELVELIGLRMNDQGNPSQLSTQVGEKAKGNGGDLTVETGRLILQDGARIETGTIFQGSASNLTIKARESVELSGARQIPGRDEIYRSSLVTTADSRAQGGNAGNLTVETRRLIIRDGATVNTSTFSGGLSGNLTVRASELVELSGTANVDEDRGRFSSLRAESTDTGNAGNLSIETGQLILRDGANVSVGSEGTGNAGTLTVEASSIKLDNQSSIEATTAAGNQGNIFLRSQDLVLRNGSFINTNATGAATGGNIDIDTGVIAAFEDSDISADADAASGGRVIINAQGIFGTEFRIADTPESDITASSNLGPQFSGSVEINTPEVDPSQGLVALPAELVDASNQIAAGCAVGGESIVSNKFIITGRGGLPPSPNEPLSSEAVLTHWATLDSGGENLAAEETTPALTSESAPHQIVEANGWAIAPNGQVSLTANASIVTPNSSSLIPTSCNGS